MPLLKLRGLGRFGCLPDIDPYDLPPQAFSFASNVRFKNERIERGPSFRACATTALTHPRHAINFISSAGDKTYVAYLNGRVQEITPTSETDRSIAGYSNSDAEVPFTNCNLASVLYVNREDRVPWAKLPASTNFTALANWNANWRCKVLRTYNNALVAMNTTEGGTEYLTRVRTSEFPLDGAVPTSWDDTLVNNCYANVIPELKGGITDGASLGDAFYIYGQFQTYVMRATSGADLYQIKPVFTDRGCIATNCVVEIDGVHYVFGPTDIFMHDGITPKSIVDGKCKQFIYRHMNKSKSALFFVTYDPNLKEVRFNYVSTDPFVRFDSLKGTGCNRAAVYNLVNGTWSFDDLPYLLGSTVASFTASVGWDTIVPAWDLSGGSWADYGDAARRGVLCVGEAVTDYSLDHKLYGQDLYTGGVLTQGIDTNATTQAYIERDGLDLEEIDERINLSGYKVVKSVYPQGRINQFGQPLSFTFGSADSYNALPTFDIPSQTYDGVTYTQIDVMAAGRYVAMRITHPDYRDFTLSGLDFETFVSGKR